MQVRDEAAVLAAKLAAGQVEEPPVRKITHRYVDGTTKSGYVMKSETGLNEDTAHFDCGCIGVYKNNTGQPIQVTTVLYRTYGFGFYTVFCENHRMEDYQRLKPHFPIYAEYMLPLQDFAREIQDLKYMPVPRSYVKKISNRNGLEIPENVQQMLLLDKKPSGRYFVCKNRVDTWYRHGLDKYFDIVSSCFMKS